MAGAISGAAVRALLNRVALQTTILRGGEELPLAVDALVPGDGVRLARRTGRGSGRDPDTGEPAPR